MRFSRNAVNRLALTAFAVLAMALSACGGQPAPLSEPVQAQTAAPTNPPSAAPALTPQPTRPPGPSTPTRPPTSTVTANPKAAPTIIITPGFQGTSQAVILTITAQYFSPTPPATPTKKPGSIGVGAGDGSAIATSTPVNGVAVAAFSEQVSPGGAASLEIRARPGALCVISRMEGELAHPAPELPARVAGAEGGAAWIWMIDADAPAGPMVLRVDCGENKFVVVKLMVEK